MYDVCEELLLRDSLQICCFSEQGTQFVLNYTLHAVLPIPFLTFFKKNLQQSMSYHRGIIKVEAIELGVL